MTTYWKALRAGRSGTHTDFVWPEPGEWVEVDGPLMPCWNGLHVCRTDQLLDWLSEEVWRVEVDESAEVLDAGDKTVARRVRLVEQVPESDRRLRLFAADCAEHVLPLFEKERPGDDRPRLAIAAARAYARGEISDAARDAAGAAAWDAAGAAARGAAGAAAGDAAWAAAGAAARAADGDADGDAARAAAGASAGAAAWGAARGAAWGAAWAAARDAAGDAAWGAAWAAAGASARGAERQWQHARLAQALT